MSLLAYLKTLKHDEQEAFALRCGTSVGYLKQVAYGNKNCGETLGVAIDRESQGAVRFEELCPTVDWAYVRDRLGRDFPKEAA